jgi:hypothetical protein
VQSAKQALLLTGLLERASPRVPPDMSTTFTYSAKSAIPREWLVELRGFEPRIFAAHGIRALNAPRFPKVLQGLPPNAAPLDRTLAGCCFACPARAQHLEGLAGLDENRCVARRGLVSAHDHIDIERV